MALLANRERILRDLVSLSRIGVTPKGGISRLAFTVRDYQARQVLVYLMGLAGLEVQIDPLGNIYGRLKGSKKEAPSILTGSHLDTVPQGGRFDGSVGVIGALEAVRVIKEKGVALENPIEVVAFVGEESSRFGLSTIGSRAVVGEIKVEELDRFRDAGGLSLMRLFQRMGIGKESLEKCRRSPQGVKAFLELHIEQGRVLEQLGKSIGIVTAIAAPTRLKIMIEGRYDHSGATPMNMRKDALVGAAEVTLAVERFCLEEMAENTVGTVGSLKVEPGAINVIPGRAEMLLDIRSTSTVSKERVLTKIKEFIAGLALKRDLKISMEMIGDEAPIILSRKIVDLLEAICKKEGVAYYKMPSGAGHDAMNLAKLTEVGMIFIRSEEGRSHSPEEWSKLEDILLGIQILIEAIVELGSSSF